jgi:hypothetical protein
LDVSAKIMTGAAPGWPCGTSGQLRNAGVSRAAGVDGTLHPRAAASILRFRSNCKLIRVWPLLLEDVISLTRDHLYDAPAA